MAGRGRSRGISVDATDRYAALVASRTMEANGILVVDDEADTRETIRWVLESAGFAVCTAEHGEAALNALRSLANVDVNLGLVLLNLGMPVLDGNEMLRALKADPRVSAIPVTVVTGSDTPQPPLANAMLRKPVDPEALIRHVAQYCQPCQRRFDQLALCGPAARVAWASPTCLFCRRESVGDGPGTGVGNEGTCTGEQQEQEDEQGDVVLRPGARAALSACLVRERVPDLANATSGGLAT